MTKAKYYIYIYYYKDILLYIGKATYDVFNRYENHKKSYLRNRLQYLFDYVDRVSILKFDNITDMEIAESYLIMKYKPIINTRDICGKVKPRIVISNFPEEETYTLDEFLYNFGYSTFENKSKFIASENINIDAKLNEAFRLQAENNETISKERILISYSNDMPLEILNSAASFHSIDGFKRSDALRNAKANPSIITSMTEIKVNSNVEAFILYKYLCSTIKPLWHQAEKYYKTDSKLIIERINKEKKISAKQLNDYIEGVEETITDEYYNSLSRYKPKKKKRS